MQVRYQAALHPEKNFFLKKQRNSDFTLHAWRTSPPTKACKYKNFRKSWSLKPFKPKHFPEKILQQEPETSSSRRKWSVVLNTRNAVPRTGMMIAHRNIFHLFFSDCKNGIGLAEPFFQASGIHGRIILRFLSVFRQDIIVIFFGTLHLIHNAVIAH